MDDYRTQVRRDGSVLIPAAASAAAGLTPGDEVVVRVATKALTVAEAGPDAGAPAGDGDARSFLESLAPLAAAIPDSDLARLPSDLSAHLKHYLYGTPKRR